MTQILSLSLLSLFKLLNTSFSLSPPLSLSNRLDQWPITCCNNYSYYTILRVPYSPKLTFNELPPFPEAAYRCLSLNNADRLSLLQQPAEKSITDSPAFNRIFDPLSLSLRLSDGFVKLIESLRSNEANSHDICGSDTSSCPRVITISRMLESGSFNSIVKKRKESILDTHVTHDRARWIFPNNITKIKRYVHTRWL